MNYPFPPFHWCPLGSLRLTQHYVDLATQNSHFQENLLKTHLNHPLLCPVMRDLRGTESSLGHLTPKRQTCQIALHVPSSLRNILAKRTMTKHTYAEQMVLALAAHILEPFVSILRQQSTHQIPKETSRSWLLTMSVSNQPYVPSFQAPFRLIYGEMIETLGGEALEEYIASVFTDGWGISVFRNLP